MRRLALAVLALAAAAPGVLARPEGVLKPAGALTCRATPAAQSSKADTKFDCSLKLYNNPHRYKVDGRMTGPGLYLVAPGGTAVVWRVLSPTVNLDPRAISGSYDINSKYRFAFSQERADVLVGGVNDTVALQLVSPVVGAVEPDMKLTLKAGPAAYAPAG
jgi:hypothetical protein